MSSTVYQHNLSECLFLELCCFRCCLYNLLPLSSLLAAEILLPSDSVVTKHAAFLLISETHCFLLLIFCLFVVCRHEILKWMWILPPIYCFCSIQHNVQCCDFYLQTLNSIFYLSGWIIAVYCCCHTANMAARSQNTPVSRTRSYFFNLVKIQRKRILLSLVQRICKKIIYQ